MKNVIRLLAVVIFMSTATIQAQNKPACCTKKAEKKIEMMREKLSLSDDQVVQVTVLVKEGGEGFEEKIKEVLTPKQYSQFQEMSREKSCNSKAAKKKSCDTKSATKKTCCKKKADKKSCDSKAVNKKSCDTKSATKKTCCKKKADKKSCDPKAVEKKSCKKDGEKKSCSNKKA